MKKLLLPLFFTFALHAASLPPYALEMIDDIDQQIASGVASNQLYTLITPEGLLRMRIIVRYEGKMQLSFFNTPAGVALCHDGPSSLTSPLIEAIENVALEHGLEVRLNLGGRINGESSVDAFESF